MGGPAGGPGKNLDMSNKGISDVITIIIILLVAVSLAGAFFLWVGRSTSELQESAGQQINQTATALTQLIRVESASNSGLVIRNIGSSNVDTGSLAIFINGTLTTGGSWNPTSIPVNQVSQYTPVTCPGDADVKITSPGGESIGKCR